MADSKQIPADGNTDIQADCEDDGGPCKWGTFKPHFCQRFRKPGWVLFWLCWVGGLQGMLVSGFVNVIITTIERRFEISSTETGTIVSSYDIASAICLIPVSYFGGLGVKPRYIGIGVFALGVGSFLFALPHFTTGLYTVENTQDTVCIQGGNATTTCDTTTNYGSISNYMYVFVLAQLLHGAGSSPFYTLGVTYLDENLPLRSSALYIGIYYSCVILGTALGYLAGGELLNIWTDVDVVDTSSLSITPDNRKWVGAWWLGFVISGVIALVISVPLAGFPRALPGSSKYRQEKEAEVYGGREKEEPEADDATQKHAEAQSEKRLVKDILHSTKLLLTNPTFMFLNLAGASEAIIVGGFSTFAPKFLESEFSLPAARAAQYVGLVVIPAGGGGTLLGGYLVKRFNLKVRGILRMCLASTLTVCVLGLGFLIHCDNVPFAGVNVRYQNSSTSLNIEYLGKRLDNTCNSNCACTEDDYHPVCGRDGLTYFSPCYAGCTVIQYGEVTRYNNCSCISSNATDYMAEFTRCETSCMWLPLFLPIFALMMFFTFVISMPSLTATLRVVSQKHRSFGLGIQWLVVRCLGAIPGPILFGKMIDLSCLLWQKRCDGNGSCFFYDNKLMSYYLMALGISLKALSSVFFFLALVLYKKSPHRKIVEVDSKLEITATDASANGIDNPVFYNSTEKISIGREDPIIISGTTLKTKL
ncbi:solute carrier organic anion transporter family member 4A1-like [Haliotis rufescens]|uniref:solute carrier organic anion transporter family member 4A1-like n=1 Tax=Haliotis rufescens TaxID=6454 RepID=UPI00201FA72A|nr:solute carrier organic anion transporter family member 4A1-like [Haliotis rufescens]